MKKIVSIVLVFVLSLSALMCGTIFAEAPISDGELKSLQEVEVLSDLGIIMDKNRFNITENVTRGDFAVLIARLLRPDTLTQSEFTFFADVPTSNPASAAVAALVEEGIVTGIGNGEFGVDDYITYHQAIKMVISILGYNPYAQQKGGYPTGHLSVASELKLLRNIKLSDEHITGEIAAKLIYNALEVNIMQMNKVIGDEATYVVPLNKTLLSENMNIEKIEGRVTQNYLTALSGESNLGSGFVRIDSETFVLDNKKAVEYIGFYVTAYAKEDKNTGQKTIISIRYNDRYNNLVKVNAEDILPTETTKTNIVYLNDSDRTVNLKISPIADVIYNGKSLRASYTADTFRISSGHIELIDVEGDGSYDIIRVTEFQDIFIGNDLTDDTLIIYDEIDKSISVDVNPNTAVVTVWQDDSEASLGNVSANTLLSVAASASNMGYQNAYVNIIINNNTVRGRIQELGEEYVIINDTVYNISSAYRGVGLTVDAEGMFYLNSDNKIAFGKAEPSSDLMYGYIFKLGKMPGINQQAQIKILNTANEYEVMNCADRVWINNKTVKTYEELLQELLPTRLVPFGYENADFTKIEPLKDDYVNQLIKYGINTDGEINRIYTTNEVNKDVFSVDVKLGRYAHKRDNRSFGGLYLEFFSDANTYFLLVPDINATNVQREDEKSYAFVRTGVRLTDTGDTQVMQAYDLNESGVAAVCLKEEEMGANTELGVQSPMGLVQRVVTGINEDGEIVKKLVVYEKGIEQTLEAEESALFEGLDAGDVVRYRTNRQGKVDVLRCILDYSEWDFNEYHEPIVSGSRGGTYQRQDRVVFAAIYSVTGRCMRVTPNYDKLGTSQESEIIFEYSLLDKAPITVYNESTKKVRRGTIDDLKNNTYFANPNSRIVYLTGMGLTESVFVFER